MVSRNVRRDGDRLEDLPNVGPAVAEDLRRMGIDDPAALQGLDPYEMYDRLNRITGVRHDPCMLDTFIAVVDFVGGAPARPWWTYTAQRKRRMANIQDKQRPSLDRAMEPTMKQRRKPV